MKPDPNEIKEARLTAYALGELPADQCAEVEAELAADPAARQTVKEIQIAAGYLIAELAAENAPPLSDERRQAVLAEAPAARRRSRIYLPLSLAACLEENKNRDYQLLKLSSS